MDAKYGSRTESLQARLRCHEAAAGAALISVLGLEIWSFICWRPGAWAAALMIAAGWVFGAMLYAFIAPSSRLTLHEWYGRVPGLAVFWTLLGMVPWALSAEHQTWWYAIVAALVTAVWVGTKATHALLCAHRFGRHTRSRQPTLTASAATRDATASSQR